MKCKIFKIPLTDETGNSDAMKFNEFLETVSLSQTFASVVNNEFWSIVIFYEDGAVNATSFVKDRHFPERIPVTENFQPVTTATEKSAKAHTIAPDLVVLTTEQEKTYAALRNWRNEQASQTGLAPYMIAHNDSLMQIAILQVKTKEDLLQIKGFGEKRAEKYGDEILSVLSVLSAAREMRNEK